jgi:hypothetical protein
MEYEFIEVSNSNYGSKSHQLRADGWKAVPVTRGWREKMRSVRATQLMKDYIKQRGLAGVGAMTNVSALETIIEKMDEEVPLKGILKMEMYQRIKKSNDMSVNNMISVGEEFLPETGPHAEAAAAANANVDLMTNAQLKAYKEKERAILEELFQTLLEQDRVRLERVRIGNTMTNNANAPSAEATSIFNWKPSAAAAANPFSPNYVANTTSSSGVGLWNKYRKNLPNLSLSINNPVIEAQLPKPKMGVESLVTALNNATKKRHHNTISNTNNNNNNIIPAAALNNATKKRHHNTNNNNNNIIPAAKRTKRSGDNRTNRTRRNKRNKRTKKNKKH